jgi:hypothetical protein
MDTTHALRPCVFAQTDLVNQTSTTAIGIYPAGRIFAGERGRRRKFSAAFDLYRCNRCATQYDPVSTYPGVGVSVGAGVFVGSGVEDGSVVEVGVLVASSSLVAVGV